MQAFPAPSRAWYLSGEAIWLLFLCILDTALSAWLFHRGLAVEGNPLLRPYAEMGLVPFVIAKLLTFLPALLFLEAFRHRNPLFYRWLLRGASGVYASVYLLLAARQFL